MQESLIFYGHHQYAFSTSLKLTYIVTRLMRPTDTQQVVPTILTSSTPYSLPVMHAPHHGLTE